MVDDLETRLQILVALKFDLDMLDENGDGRPLFGRLYKKLGELDDSTMYGYAYLRSVWGAHSRRVVRRS